MNDDKYNRIVIQISEPIVFSAHRLVSPWLEVTPIAGMMHLIAARTESCRSKGWEFRRQELSSFTGTFETCILQLSLSLSSWIGAFQLPCSPSSLTLAANTVH